jgi:hypothetical protein
MSRELLYDISSYSGGSYALFKRERTEGYILMASEEEKVAL